MSELKSHTTFAEFFFHQFAMKGSVKAATLAIITNISTGYPQLFILFPSRPILLNKLLCSQCDKAEDSLLA